MESLNTTTIYGDLLNTTTYDFILNNDSEISFNSVVCSPEPIAVNATELTGLGKFNEAYAGVHGYQCYGVPFWNGCKQCKHSRFNP